MGSQGILKVHIVPIQQPNTNSHSVYQPIKQGILAKSNHHQTILNILKKGSRFPDLVEQPNNHIP